MGNVAVEVSATQRGSSPSEEVMTKLVANSIP